MKKLLKYIQTNKLIIVILLVAAFLRLWRLGINPPHLAPDEASLWYNAYSILKTGRDEYGKLLPIIFKSFGDFKPGLYVYTAIPTILLFGLTEFTVRLPSAIAGIIAVYFLYLIIGKLFKNNKSIFTGKSLALVTSFFLAISPWHIHFSRGAWEVNLSLTLTLVGIYFFLKAIDQQKYLVWSAVFFALTLVAYQGAKLSTGIVLLILTFLYWKDCIRFDRKLVLKSVVVGLIISLPIIVSMFQGKAGRLTVFSVFSYPRPVEYVQTFLDQGEEVIGGISYYLFHSEGVNFVRGIMGRWFNHYSPRFLFFEGDWANPRHSIPNHGVMLLFDLILVIAGLIGLAKYGKTKESKFIWLWLILAPLPSILSRDQVHAIRAYNLVIPMIVVSSIGVMTIYSLITKNKSKLVQFGLKGVALIIFVLSYTYFLDAYFIHQPKHNSKYWDYGMKQVVEIVTPIQGNYEKVLVQQSFAQPYIYFLFFQKYDPSMYQENAELVASEYKFDVGYVKNLDNIEFGPIDWSVNRGDVGTLFVADTIRIPPGDSMDTSQHNIVSDIKYLNGRDTVFRVIEVIK